MESVDFYDRYLDPPEYPTHSECVGCGEMFDTGDLTKLGVPGDYRWVCAECAEEET